MQRWIYDQGWTALHDAQEWAIPAILAGDRDVIISAATAAGKTEAAFLPICSALAGAPETVTGPDVLYVSPLKALINDQYDRLDLLGERAGLGVHRWHGDVSSSAKVRTREMTGGILLITPESLEAFFVRRGTEARRFFGRLRYVVIDELHSFLDTPRGAQLQSLLTRVDLAAGRRAPRIGLSATLADMLAARTFLCPAAPDAPLVIESTAEHELQLHVRGYRAPVPAPDEDVPGSETAIAEHLFKTLRGADNLVFANSRREVEIYSTLLGEMSERRRAPREFWPHHGSLAKGVRDEVERRLKERTQPVTAVCTSTLELGIDIGSMASVAQIGPPPSVAALRQRLGRSGRRGDPSVLRLYIAEPELEAKSSLVDHLRCDLFQTVAMIDLLLGRWLEPVAGRSWNLSTLVQQTLALIAQHSGVRAQDAYRVLCGPGPFADVEPPAYAQLLQDLAAVDLVMQASDGTLLHGALGERLVNHYSFYAAFHTPEEWRLVAGGQTLGTVPIDHPLEIGGLLLFAGRRWRVADVDSSSHTIELKPARGGSPPRFGGGGASVYGEVRRGMARTYASDFVPPYLDATARALLEEGRATWRGFDLADAAAIGWDGDTYLLPWEGDDVLWTMALALRRAGVEAEPEGPLLRLIEQDVPHALAKVRDLAGDPAPDPENLARLIENREIDKWDWALGTDLSVSSYAQRVLDVEMAWSSLRALAARVGSIPSHSTGAEVRRPSRPALDPSETVFCVIDVETTGFSPRLGDRVVEIATVRMSADGTVLDEWSTLVNPERDVGPAEIHGIAAADVAGAPRFAEIAGDVLTRLDGAVVAAHNLRFDWSFLATELERLGHQLPAFPAVCTLALGAELMPGLSDRRLDSCCAAMRIEPPDGHTAVGDAHAAAALLAAYIRRTWEKKPSSLESLGCRPLTWPAELPQLKPSGITCARRSATPRGRQASFLAAIVAGLPSHGAADPDLAAYLQILDRALADRRLSEAERAELCRTADAWGLVAETIQRAHRRYLAALVEVAQADGRVTDAERRDLARVEALLGLQELDELLR